MIFLITLFPKHKTKNTMLYFKTIDNAIEYIINTSIPVNQFYQIVRELEETNRAKCNNMLLIIKNK